VIKRTLGNIAAMCGGTLSDQQFAEKQIAGVTKDTRGDVEGRLYVPIVGERFDGHQFAPAAVEAGAAASLWQQGLSVPDELAHAPLVYVDDTLAALQRLAAAYREQLDVRIIGVTGSNGKTSTKDMVASVLSDVFRVHKTAGNLNNHIGLPLTVLQLDETVDVAVLEMGMSGFEEIELLTHIARPDIAIITNIGDAHLLQLGSRAGIAQAKLEIAAGLRPGGLLLYNGDEPLLTEGVASLQLPAGAHQQTFGFNENSDWTAEHIELQATSTQFDAVCRLTGGTRIEKLELLAPGRHNVANALAAIAAGQWLAAGEEAIRGGLRGLNLTGMRIEPLRARNGALLLSDVYNASPTATRAAIDLVAGLSGYRRKWLVLADMLELGPSEAELHSETGSYITPEKADALLTYGPLASHIAAAAAQNFGGSEQAEGQIVAFQDKPALIEWLQERLSPEDLVLVKGSRGMRMEEVIHALKGG